MIKRLGLVFGFMAVLVLFGGCRFLAPVAESWGGCPCGAHGVCCCPSNCDTNFCDTKTRAMWRQWGRCMRKQERFIDTYFFNYDINDPYRGDCITGY